MYSSRSSSVWLAAASVSPTCLSTYCSPQDPFGDAEQVLDKHLRDPRVDEREKAHIRALLLAIEDSGKPRDLHANSGGG